MAKRFIDTGLFQDEWFTILSNEGRLFWIYYLTNCDHAGFLKLNTPLIQFHLRIESIDTVLDEIGIRLIRVKEHLLFCPKFIEFQYPNGLNPNVKAQKSVIDLLAHHGVDLNSLETVKQQLPNPLVRVQDKDRDIEKDKDIDYPFSEKFKEKWREWKLYLWNEHQQEYKSAQSEKSALKMLVGLANNIEAKAVKFIDHSMGKRYKAIYEPTSSNGHGKPEPDEQPVPRSQKPLKRD